MYKLIATDIDGTLLDSQKNLTGETLKAIRLAVEQGVIFTICTGRPIQGVEPLIAKLDLDLPFITYNGAVIVKGKSKEVLYDQKMSPADVKTVMRLGEHLGATNLLWVNNQLYADPLNENALQYSRISKTPPQPITDLEALLAQGVTKVLWCDEVETINRWHEMVGPFLTPTINYHTSQPFLLEFVDHEVSKAKALARLGAIYGIKQEEMIAIGDGFNDLSMIKYAGLGVAMANAPEAIKAEADYITLSNDEDGVAHVIYRFVLEKEY